MEHDFMCHLPCKLPVTRLTRERPPSSHHPSAFFQPTTPQSPTVSLFSSGRPRTRQCRRSEQSELKHRLRSEPELRSKLCQSFPIRMSSHKESNDEIETPHVELSDGESVELLDELKDKNQASSIDGDSKAKRKNSSEVWAHFVEVDAMYKGKMVKKKQCIHCKHTYVVSTGGTTSSLKRHLTSCAYFKRSKDDEWSRAEKVCKLLEVFLKATNLFSGSLYPTSNLFLIEIFKVKKEITNAFISGDTFLNTMSIPMYEKFEKYWGEIGVLMSIASILDPRFKLVSVEWTFERLYPPNECDSRVEDVTRKLKTLFEKYLKSFVASKAALSKSTASTSFDNQQSAKEEETLEVNIPTLNEC
ncbi:hypothetical protein E3N88_01566 [Mikania micrantha]|uniref:BED-type domain-containing protein n=1 Tax=Mikania micrantha TaxID=192012 RepID=A0A5N6Q420_9ASTR|nr:hypothetical protein E3N88_01566 [Mikania micrantha]